MEGPPNDAMIDVCLCVIQRKGIGPGGEWGPLGCFTTCRQMGSLKDLPNISHSAAVLKSHMHTHAHTQDLYVILRHYKHATLSLL